MDKAVRHHMGKDIKERVQLTGGYMFETWLLTLAGGQKMVFRSQRDFETGGGRKIIIAEILEREKFFYESVNKSAARVCPEVYVVDGTREHHENSFCIMEYMEGTPLDQCFDGLDPLVRDDIQYRIGKIAAWINKIEIDPGHPYIKERGPWEAFMADRLRERLAPLVHNEIITQAEIDRIAQGMLRQKAAKTLSFLHLDMRRVNMIYNKGSLYILDAANCEFGDPLFELAVMDVGGELEPSVIAGYKRAGGDADLNSGLYDYYKMECQALVLNLLMNRVKNDTKSTKIHLEGFSILKDRLLHHS